MSLLEAFGMYGGSCPLVSTTILNSRHSSFHPFFSTAGALEKKTIKNIHLYLVLPLQSAFVDAKNPPPSTYLKAVVFFPQGRRKPES